MFSSRLCVAFPLGILLSVATGMAASKPEAYHPMNSPFGIVFTNKTGTCLYLSLGDTVKQIFSSPGCGEYFTLSPDRSEIGFKEIYDDGTQAPALLDIATDKVTPLHMPVPLAGQVSFADNGTIAYSIGDDVIVQNGGTEREYDIGTYSNIVALSSDGAYAAYTDFAGNVYVLDLQSGQTNKTAGPGCMLPIWSPVGRRLCYSSLDGKLFVFSEKDGNTHALGDGTDPSWTPGGNSLVAVRKETQNDSLTRSDLYQISYNGKAVAQLTTEKGIFETQPSIGPDGKILFCSSNSGALYCATLEKGKLIDRTPIEIHSYSAIDDAKEVPSSISSVAVTPDFELPYTNQVYDTPSGFGNLGSSACGPTSAIMVIGYYNLLPTWDLTVALPTKHVSEFGNYVLEPYHFHGVYFTGGGYGYMWNTGSDPMHTMASYYSDHGLTAREVDAPPLDSIVDEVNAGYPYTLCNGLTSAGHIIIINGVGNEEGTLICNDPYGNKNLGEYPNYYGKDVEYDYPGYNNGNQNLNEAWWGVSVRYTRPVWPDSIVDDLQFSTGPLGSDGFSLNNSQVPMSLWLDRNSGYDAHEWYVDTQDSNSCIAEWRPTLKKSGSYKVTAYVYFTNPGDFYSIADSARYMIHYDGDSTLVTVDQGKYIAGSWVPLGSYPFQAGDRGYVELMDDGHKSGQILIVDAVKWSYQSPLVVQNNPPIPAETELSQNYPNPFNPSTVIQFEVSSSRFVNLEVYDVLGREVRTLVDKMEQPGNYTVTFNAGNLPSGVYFYRLSAGNYTAVKKMIVVK